MSVTTTADAAIVSAIVVENSNKKRAIQSVETEAVSEEESGEATELGDRLALLSVDVLEERAKVTQLQSQLQDAEREINRLRAENKNMELRVTLALREKNEAVAALPKPTDNCNMPPPPRVTLPPLPRSDAGQYRGEQFDRHWVNRDTIRSFIRANVSYVKKERQTEILIPKEATDHDLLMLLLHTVFGEHHARHEEARENFEKLSAFFYHSTAAFAVGRGIGFEGCHGGQYL